MNSTKSKFAQSGFSLLEVLITMLIILIGLFGIAALQGKAQIAELESYQRAQALILLSDIADRINANRGTATCFNITTDTTNGTPFIGASGTGHLGTPVCSASGAAYNSQTINTINNLDSFLQGTAESLGGSSVGAMVGARACISYDASTELPGLPSTGLYTIAVSWQAMAELTTPTANCANGLYDTETKRRTVSTTIRIADLY
jgi:type IV pilus assembly protein PilV